MPIIETILIAVGLSMDAFAVSVSDGLCMKKIIKGKAFLVAAFFGVFQAVMPMFGYLLGASFAGFIVRFDHIIALVFLGFIGGKMLFDGLKKDDKKDEKDKKEDILTVPKLFLQAVATSIDALVVGVSFVAMGMTHMEMFAGVSIIGAVTFVLSLSGVFAGKKFGEKLGGKAVVFGGIILMGIGLKIFIEHSFFAG